MSVLREVLSELVGMFLADAKLAGAIIGVVAVCALLIDVVQISPLIAGGLLLAGCVATIAAVTAVESVPKGRS